MSKGKYEHWSKEEVLKFIEISRRTVMSLDENNFIASIYKSKCILSDLQNIILDLEKSGHNPEELSKIKSLYENMDYLLNGS